MGEFYKRRLGTGPRFSGPGSRAEIARDGWDSPALACWLGGLLPKPGWCGHGRGRAAVRPIGPGLRPPKAACGQRRARSY